MTFEYRSEFLAASAVVTSIMADDTRQHDAVSSDQPQEAQVRRPRRPRRKPEQTQAGKMWEAFGNPEQPINTMPGGMVNTAGGRPAEVTWRDAFKFSHLKRSDMTTFYRKPCARDSLMVGIGVGGGIGGLRFVLTGLSTVLRSANYAVGAFVTTTSAMYYWCDQRRRVEAEGMAKAVAGMKLLNERKAREQAAQEAAEAAARAVEEEGKRSQSWYRFW